MFSICRQIHPATGIEHAVSCCFFTNDEPCLVTAGANILKVFRLVPDTYTKEVNAAGQPIPPKMKLECLATYTLWGNIMSLVSVKCQSSGRDLLLLSFKEAKMSVVQYDPQTNNLITLSMHYFEEDDMKNGWTTHPHIPLIRVDPEHRCAVMLLYGKKLAVIPFRKDMTNEEDPLESKPLENKKIQPTPQAPRAPTLASYVIVLKELDEKIDNVIDLQFLHGYYEPTLLILYEPVKTFAGRVAVRSDTCAMAGVSLNMSARVHPVIWATAGLPFDCLQAVAIQKPLGGCLIMAVNSLIYLNQSVPPYGVSLNSIAAHTTNFPLRVQEGVCITLDAACVAHLGEGRLVLSLKGGQLYVLTLISDSVRSVRSFHLDRAAASVLTTCMCVIEDDFLFLGSRLGNSLLLRVTERENRMIFSVDKPLEATVDLTGSETEAGTEEEAGGKRRRTEPETVDAELEMDELHVYGANVRTSTQLTGYVFEVCDSLLNICPIGAACIGEAAGEAAGEAGGAELVACSGHGKNGALTVLRRAIRPTLLTSFHLPGCIDMWTIFGDSSRDGDPEHAYLLLTQEDSTMVLETGQEINEVDSSGFMTGAPTVFAGNLGGNKYMVQVTTLCIRLVKNGVQIQSIQLEWTAQYGNTADPYLCVVSTCGRVMILALREFRGKDNNMTARLAPTRQTLPHHPPLVRATIYRDVSGLFSSADEENVQVKGEFTGKVKGKNVKAEGFKPDTVIELNDEDEMLYGGDQTPASMASIMLAEQGGVGRGARSGRRWRRREARPSYWTAAARRGGSLEIYSLPDLRLSMLLRGVAQGPTVLTDSLESVAVIPETIEEDEVADTRDSDMEKLREIMICGLGHKGSRVFMFLRFDEQLMIYEAYRYPRGNLKIRFSRVNLTFPFGYEGLVNTDENQEVAILKENVQQLRYFGNVCGVSGVWACGARPALVACGRGEVRAHPLALAAAPARPAAPLHTTHAPHAFLYFTLHYELRICTLPTHVSYETQWAARKVPLRHTPHFVVYHVESRTYCVVLSSAAPTNTYYKFNGEDKEKATENKGERFPYPLQERFAVTLFSPVSWEIIPNTRIEMEEWEHITCLKNVSLSYEGTRSGLRGYIAIGTNYNYSEDITSRGRIIIYDIIDVVPEPGQPLTKNRFKEIYAKEQKGPVTALTQVLGFLITAIGQKIYLWQLKDNDLVGVAFIDTQIYVHRMMSINNLVLIADVYKSISLLRYQQHHRTLSLLSRDLRSAQVYDMEFMIDNTSLAFLVSEAEGNLAMFMYQPQARESYGGQRLIRKADYRVGQQVNSMFRIAARPSPDMKHTRHVTMYTTLDGGIGYVLPIAERIYRRLLMLQNVLNNYVCHTAGLNPRAYRTYKAPRKYAGQAPVRGILDGDLIVMFHTLPNPDKVDIAKKIGTKVEEIVADLNEIDRQTAHF